MLSVIESVAYEQATSEGVMRASKGIIIGYKRMFDYSRASQPEYWWVWGQATYVGFISFVITEWTQNELLANVLGLWVLVVVLCYISAAIRRLHDAGMSGWLVLLALIPALGLIAQLYIGVQESIESETEACVAPPKEPTWAAERAPSARPSDLSEARKELETIKELLKVEMITPEEAEKMRAKVLGL